MGCNDIHRLQQQHEKFGFAGKKLNKGRWIFLNRNRTWAISVQTFFGFFLIGNQADKSTEDLEFTGDQTNKGADRRLQLSSDEEGDFQMEENHRNGGEEDGFRRR
ncbi:hypothetical protein U1Q18_004421 [Sarracenia purpurea var. burkii]